MVQDELLHTTRLTQYRRSKRRGKATPFLHVVLRTRAVKRALAHDLPSILPKLTVEEALDITRIYSVTGQLAEGTPLINQRPFRSPHHTIIHAGLVGGGRLCRWPILGHQRRIGPPRSSERNSCRGLCAETCLV